MAVVRGLESRQMNNKNVKIIGVVITWGMSLVLAIPTAVIAHIKLEIICTKIILSQVPGLLYDLYYFLTLYFVPLMVISTLYVSIAMTLYKSGHHHAERHQARLEQSKTDLTASSSGDDLRPDHRILCGLLAAALRVRPLEAGREFRQARLPNTQ